MNPQPPITAGLLDPKDSPARQIEKLLTIAAALMSHAEQGQGDRDAAFEEFRRAAVLEEHVRQRTRELEAALRLLHEANSTAESSRRQLSQAVEAIEEGFALFDPEQRLVLHNSRFCGDLPDARARLHPGISFPDYIRAVSHSENLRLPPDEGPEAWVEKRMALHRSDRIFYVDLTGDRWLQISEQHMEDGSTVVLQTNVTEIIRAERSERGKLLDDQARIIRATLDHINQGVAIFDAERRLAGWNWRLAQLLDIRAPLLRRGVDYDALIAPALSHTAFSDGFSPERLRAWIWQSGPCPPLSFEIEQPTGMVLAVYGQEMPGRGFVLSFTDVSRERLAIHSMLRANATLEARVATRTEQLAAALASAERANATRSRFVAAASHDLLQPLSAAKLFVAAARDEAGPGQSTTLEKAYNALISVEGILGALLDISRLEAGSGSIDVTPLPLSLLLAQLTDEFVPFAAEKGLRLTILPCALAVESDPAYLRRILQNLIGNALRYTSQGRVLVGVRRLKGAVRVEVHDTGPGIAPEDQQAVFREFHRIGGSASAAAGMGLGLAIVERACALLRHPLTLRSRPGLGTCFAVELPVAPDLPPAGLAPAPLQMEDAPCGRIALLVENDEGLRRAIALLLERRGIDVLEAASGPEAIGLLEEIGIVPDLYLIDQQLGAGPTGVETARILHRTFGQRPTRIITADRTAATRTAAGAAGLEIMFKPIDPDALGAFVLQSD
ncbi:hybrid sensor histidine kinase/response regulator [Pseudogemmobacter faecipullorum]|uniref:histidine kinase n=1 Tax=Pseudogemmobacter faecipullorum TaxID=2755041 RepID=A0ABS8CPF2_9RHOB|nr:PAS-domain containing protein [Pseudogemmobacter faecipullorum]MCB5411272.1 PAS-domain containing protein [Pseudogemmobacter faecipullorum]